jgi:predicted nucleic acid-binding protein
MPNGFGKTQNVMRRTKSSVSKARATGYLDTNVIIHALSRDAHAEECRRLLSAVRDGQISVLLEPIIVHEITYSLPRYAKQMQRSDVAEYLESVIHL